MGLAPEWRKDPLEGTRPFNARAETVMEKASFRGPWRHRRGLLPADAFFEKGHRIARSDGEPFWLAALWDRWIGPDGSEVESAPVLTVKPNELVAPLHERMPVIIPAGLEQAWCAPLDDCGPRPSSGILGCLRALEPFIWRMEGLRRLVNRYPNQSLLLLLSLGVLVCFALIAGFSYGPVFIQIALLQTVPCWRGQRRLDDIAILRITHDEFACHGVPLALSWSVLVGWSSVRMIQSLAAHGGRGRWLGAIAGYLHLGSPPAGDGGGQHDSARFAFSR